MSAAVGVKLMQLTTGSCLLVSVEPPWMQDVSWQPMATSCQSSVWCSCPQIAHREREAALADAKELRRSLAVFENERAATAADRERKRSSMCVFCNLVLPRSEHWNQMHSGA